MSLAAERAATIPPVLQAMSIELTTTCQIAVRVSKNATDAQLFALAELDAQRRPLSAAVGLLVEAARLADEQDRPGPQQKAVAELAALLDSVDWSKLDSWNDQVNGKSVFWALARATSLETVKVRLAEALAQSPDIVYSLVSTCADWYEQHDQRTGQIHFRRDYRELPAWFPTEAVLTAAAAAPDPTNPERGDDSAPDALLLQVQRLASETA